MLRDHLGEAKYNRVIHVVRKVKALRLRHCCKAMVNPARQQSKAQDKICKETVVITPDAVLSSDNSCRTSLEEYQEQLEDSKKEVAAMNLSMHFQLPVLRSVYFRCNLVNTLQAAISARTSDLDEERRVYGVDWDHLLEEAESILDIYEASMSPAASSNL
uniref:Uncharacterized protein n=1 Tax=Ditylum brightwellii TaxID=49249 RepID=A0A7S2EA92_9STRA